MNYKIIPVEPENFKNLRVNYSINIGGKINQSHINKMVNDYIRQLQNQGYSNEQIEKMDIKVYYTEYER